MYLILFMVEIIKEEFEKLRPKCNCPDHELIPWKEYYENYGIPKYIVGHNRKGKMVLFTEEHKINISKSLKGKQSKLIGIPKSKVHKLNISKSLKGIPSQLKGRKLTATHISKISESKKKRYSDPKNHPNYQGGISFEPYCEKYNDQNKEEARAKYNYECLNCGKSQFENISKSGKIRYLDTHHIHYDKQEGCNGKQIEIIPLCMSCHRKSNFNRIYWQEHFKYLLLLWKIKEMMNKWY